MLNFTINGKVKTDVTSNNVIEIEDTISFLNDIYDTGINIINYIIIIIIIMMMMIASVNVAKIFAGVIWDNFVGPFFLSAICNMSKSSSRNIKVKGAYPSIHPLIPYNNIIKIYLFCKY